MPLIAQNALWIVPAFALTCFMVYAMMECTVSFLVKRPPPGRKTVDAAELRHRLLGLNQPGNPYRLVDSRVADLELHWDVVDASWYELFAKVKLTIVYHARMLIDELQREVRWYEIMRSSNFLIGFDGWTLRLNFAFRLQTGYLNVDWRGLAYGIISVFPPRIGRVYKFHLNTMRVKNEITRIVTESGWALRPRYLWFQTRRGSYQLGQALLPATLRRWPARRFWGLVYPASYVLTIGYLVAITGAYDFRNLLVFGAISAAWWGVWGFLAWILVLTSRDKAQRPPR